MKLRHMPRAMAWTGVGGRLVSVSATRRVTQLRPFAPTSYTHLTLHFSFAIFVMARDKDLDPNWIRIFGPPGSGSGSAFEMQIRIRINVV